MKTKIFDAAKFCHQENCCPVAELDSETRMVTISDPAKPERGSHTMSVEHWNALIANAKPITLEN